MTPLGIGCNFYCIVCGGYLELRIKLENIYIQKKRKRKKNIYTK